LADTLFVNPNLIKTTQKFGFLESATKEEGTKSKYLLRQGGKFDFNNIFQILIGYDKVLIQEVSE